MYIYRFVKLPLVEKQVEKRTTVKKATADRGGGGSVTRGKGVRHSTRTSTQQAIAARVTQEKTEIPKSLKKEGMEDDIKLGIPVVQCARLAVYGGESKGYKCCQTAHRGTPYKGPIQGTKPIVRCETPQNLDNLKDAPRNNDNKGLDFTNNATVEVVEEQLYSSNIILDAEIRTENEMSYEEWLVAQSLVGLKSASVEHQTEETLPGTVEHQTEETLPGTVEHQTEETFPGTVEHQTEETLPGTVQVEVENINKTLDAMLEFLQ